MIERQGLDYNYVVYISKSPVTENYLGDTR
jgi:hypothetical protein